MKRAYKQWVGVSVVVLGIGVLSRCAPVGPGFFKGSRLGGGFESTASGSGPLFETETAAGCLLYTDELELYVTQSPALRERLAETPESRHLVISEKTQKDALSQLRERGGFRFTAVKGAPSRFEAYLELPSYKGIEEKRINVVLEQVDPRNAQWELRLVTASAGSESARSSVPTYQARIESLTLVGESALEIRADSIQPLPSEAGGRKSL